MTTLSYRCSNDRIYFQPLLNRAEDKANILAARADWRADGVIPIRAFEDVFPKWINQMDVIWKGLGMEENTKAEAIRVGVPTETNSIRSRSWYNKSFHATHMIYEKITDAFVGFGRSWYNGNALENIVVCLHPDQRGKGYINDYQVIGGKSWFIYNEGQTYTIFTPKGQSVYYVENPDIEVYKRRFDRIDPVDYIKTEITKEQYTDWMDLPANQADRDANFTIERYIEV